MQGTRLVGLALLMSVVFAAAGCYYRVENYGYSREIGIGKVGCQVANPLIGAPLIGAPSIGAPSIGVSSERHAPARPAPPEQLVSVAVPSEPAVSPALKAAGPAAAPPQAVEDPTAHKRAEGQTRFGPFLPKMTLPKLTLPELALPELALPKLPAPTPEAPRSHIPLPPPPEKGWVGLPAF
jgi:hypothetical protein